MVFAAVTAGSPSTLTAEPGLWTPINAESRATIIHVNTILRMPVAHPLMCVLNIQIDCIHLHPPTSPSRATSATNAPIPALVYSRRLTSSSFVFLLSTLFYCIVLFTTRQHFALEITYSNSPISSPQARPAIGLCLCLCLCALQPALPVGTATLRFVRHRQPASDWTLGDGPMGSSSRCTSLALLFTSTDVRPHRRRDTLCWVQRNGDFTIPDHYS